MRAPKWLRAGLLLLVLVAGATLCPAQAGGTVTISYTLFRIPRMASNQLAVWIEDEEGRFLRTLFATDFMARRRGFRRRPQVCPEWVQASGLQRIEVGASASASGAAVRYLPDASAAEEGRLVEGVAARFQP